MKLAWFNKLCRNAGLMIHHIRKPVGMGSRKQVVNRTIEEKTLSKTTTLRRTTIDEIEVKQDDDQEQK